MNIKLTPLFLAFSLLIIFPVMSDDSVNKSPSDTREYNVFTLKNGIDVVTVSDPNIVTSAATLSIGVGAFALLVPRVVTFLLLFLVMAVTIISVSVSVVVVLKGA